MDTPLWKKHLMPDIHTLKGKRVLIRVDWNMPVKDGIITDTSRFDITVPFLKSLSFAGAKIILMTHFGEKGESLQPIASHITKELPFIYFVKSLDFDELENKSHSLKEGDGMLLENVRIWKGETDNIPSLAQSFANLGDIFINDAFSVSHRKHSSVVSVAENSLSFFGPTFVRELENLSKILIPTKPSLLIIGGAKISTKLSLIQHYLDLGVKVFIGGAMVHNLWKAQGVEIGDSLSDDNYKLSDTFINHPLLITPLDVILQTGETVSYKEIPKDGTIVDCGNETILMLNKIIDSSATVIMNGPLGLYEDGWLKGSEQILTKLADAQAITYIGGGDTVAVAHSLHLLQKFTFVSLGGGAMLDFLANGTLPGIDAVTK
jgi:phosphoglycerate kinase